MYSTGSKDGEDELELVVQESGKVSLSTHRTLSANDVRVPADTIVGIHAL
jgi:hypothetical protein